MSKLVPTLRVASVVAVTRDTDSTQMEGHAVVSARAQAKGLGLRLKFMDGMKYRVYRCVICYEPKAAPAPQP